MGNSGMITGAYNEDTTLSTPVAINKGGTGQTTAQAALDALAAASGSLVQGDIFIVDASTNLVRLSRGADNTTLMMDGSNPNWETAATGDEDLEFIAEVTLSGGAAAYIEKATGLDAYEAVIVIFNVWKGGGTNFVPELQTYTNGALDTSYGLEETIRGSTSSTAGASVIPLDANITANNMCSGSITIRTESTLACQTLEGMYVVSNVATTAAPYQGIISVQTPDDYPIQGIRITNAGTNTPLFGNTSYLLFYGVKKA